MSSSLHTRRQIYKVLEASSLRKRSGAAQFADHLTASSSTPAFLFFNVLLFLTWILVNMGVFPIIPAFDPFPFGLLTMFVSLEAIILSVFVLISQNRAAQIATLREELHLQINQIAEQEITKCLELLVELKKQTGKETSDPDLEWMLQKVDAEKLEEEIERQLQRADRSLVRQFLGNTLHTHKHSKQ